MVYTSTDPNTLASTASWPSSCASLVCTRKATRYCHRSSCASLVCPYQAVCHRCRPRPLAAWPAEKTSVGNVSVGRTHDLKTASNVLRSGACSKANVGEHTRCTCAARCTHLRRSNATNADRRGGHNVAGVRSTFLVPRQASTFRSCSLCLPLPPVHFVRIFELDRVRYACVPSSGDVPYTSVDVNSPARVFFNRQFQNTTLWGIIGHRWEQRELYQHARCTWVMKRCFRTNQPTKFMQHAPPNAPMVCRRSERHASPTYQGARAQAARCVLQTRLGIVSGPLRAGTGGPGCELGCSVTGVCMGARRQQRASATQ